MLPTPLEDFRLEQEHEYNLVKRFLQAEGDVESFLLQKKEKQDNRFNAT